MVDNYRHKGLRRKLVQHLQGKGITDERVLEAIDSIPRHFFLDNAFVEFAYQDKAFPIGAGQTISQPYTVAFQTELLEVSRGEKVLEIGTGSGYQTAVLCEVGAKVFSIERQKSLYVKTKSIIQQLGYRPRLFFGDGYLGKPGFAPFDKVLVTCGAPFVPEDLVTQLKPGGRLVIPVGAGEVQEMLVVDKKLDGTLDQRNYGAFRFVPMLNDREGTVG